MPNLNLLYASSIYYNIIWQLWTLIMQMTSFWHENENCFQSHPSICDLIIKFDVNE